MVERGLVIAHAGHDLEGERVQRSAASHARGVPYNPDIPDEVPPSTLCCYGIEVN